MTHSSSSIPIPHGPLRIKHEANDLYMAENDQLRAALTAEQALRVKVEGDAEAWNRQYHLERTAHAATRRELEEAKQSLTDLKAKHQLWSFKK